ncbi:MAG: Uma2 family endonuclease [Anaerolineae bacterium]|nr:Uma2 family endonuclease [Anaerolineae bacterium]
MTIREQVMTADAFWEYCTLPENAERHLELVEGEIIERTPLGGEHGEVAGNLFGILWNYVHEHWLGRLSAAETGYVLWKNPDPDGRDTVRAPDVGFVRMERAPEPFGERFVPFAPDLAVEVVSPGDAAAEIEFKVNQYLQYGVQVVWVVYPGTRAVMVHRRDRIQRLTEDDVLEGDEVLPGFQVRVSAIFPKRAESG